MISLVCVLATGLVVQGPPPKRPQKPWQWSLGQIREITHTVQPGKNLTPKSWPGKARVAVALSFDLDNETPKLRDNRTSPAVIAQGQYGSRAGLPRVLELLRRHRIPATFFMPAVIAKLYPASVKAVVKAGHEVGIHGWIHERNSKLTEAEERLLMGRALDMLQKVTGKRPVGIRTPSWDFSPHTLKLIQEFGLLYDSSLMADDRPYELLSHGKRTGIVELPVEWILDDYPYFGFSRYAAIRPHIGPEAVLDIWKKEFDGAYKERTLFVLTMHPHIIGHRSRIVILDKLVRYIKRHKRVWFATHEAVARVAKRGISRKVTPSRRPLGR